MSIFIEVYPCNPITKHEFLALHFIIVLIGFHGNLENVYRLFVIKLLALIYRTPTRCLGAIKEIVSSLKETRKTSLSTKLGIEGILLFHWI